MRLFVAIPLPEAIITPLVALQTAIPTARWVGVEQMHLTLFFIGETEREAAVKTALAAVQAAPFPLTLARVGRFPPGNRKPPRVLWAGIDSQPALHALQAQVTQALTGAGFTAEDRAFNPHITLARLKAQQPLPEVDRFLAQHENLRLPAFTVEHFRLYASTLTPQGAVYDVRGVYPLADSSVTHSDGK